MSKSSSAGNQGPDIRSDCFVSLELKSKGGIQIDLTSKVGALFGDSIRALAKEILAHFEIEHAKLQIDDQ